MPEKKKYRFLFAGELTAGNATFLQNLKDVISTRNDVESVWLPIETNPREWFARIPPISMNWSLKGGSVTRSRVLRAEREHGGFDAAFFNHQVIALFLRAFRKRVPSIITMDSTPLAIDSFGTLYGHKNLGLNIGMVERFKNGLTREVYENASFIMPWSHWVKDSLIHDYGIRSEKIIVVPPSINLQQWHSSEEARRSRQAGRQPVQILFVGGDYQRKGGDLLTKLAAREEFRSCEFHLVTRSFAGRRPENVFIYDNLLANSKELIELYARADIFALPTRGDLHSIASLEAMATGLPVISTAVGGIVDIIADGENGFILPIDDETGLADRLRTLMSNPEMRMRLGQNARKTVETRFNLQTNVEVIIDHMKRSADHKRQVSLPSH